MCYKYKMNKTIEKEWIEFEKYHKNMYNIYFHIFCGFLYMTCLFVLANNYRYFLLALYSLMILFTTHSVIVALSIFSILFILVHVLYKYNISVTQLCLMFVAFYFLPDVSHYLTNEPAMLNLTTITPLTIFTNVFYLLPFSIMCLLPNAK